MTRTVEPELRCCHPGCPNPWSSDYLGRKTCALHVADQRQGLHRQRSLLSVQPMRDVLPPFNERAERDGDTA